MLNIPVMTEDQIQSFHRDGFVLVRKAFDADAVKHVDRWTRELVAMPEVPGKHWVYWEKSLKDTDKKIICRIEHITPVHSGFRQLSEALRAPVGQLLGEEAVLFKEKINFKYPGADGFKPHQDSQAGWWNYTDFFISVLFTIDEATVENGCLQMVAGHHKRGLLREWEPLNDEDMKGMDFVFCPTQPGDIVFFDSYAPHASEPNMSDGTRRLYFATYNRKSAGDHWGPYHADKHKSFPPDVEREGGKEYRFRV